jgi:hypothetical protein
VGGKGRVARDIVGGGAGGGGRGANNGINSARKKKNLEQAR